MQPLHRVNQDHVTVTRQMWNGMIDAIESLQRWAVAPPLELRQSPAGRALSLRLPRQAVIVKITGTASGGGCYVGRVLTGSCTATGTSNLAMPEGMAVPGSDDAIAINLNENGASTHAVATGTYLVGAVVGMAGATKIVAFNA